MDDMTEFQLTESHLWLLRECNITWEDACYDGAPAVDIKRPYGNKYPCEQIGKILGWKPEGFVDEWSSQQLNAAGKLHREMETALQLCVLFAGRELRPGLYRKTTPYFYRSWERVGD